MPKRNWTISQQQAISARDGSLLVSAAAGSGKTAVLVQRVIERLTDPVHPVDADRLLIVTFTNAAAAEMRERIGAAIGSLLLENPESALLQRQQILMNRAHISTIHSFCGELVREYFYKLGLPPDFRISDSAEMALLRQEAMQAVMEELYEQDTGGFQRLSDAFSTGKDDSRLFNTVETLYDFIRSHPFPGRWLDEKKGMYASSLPAGETPWGQTILAYCESAASYMVSLTRNALSLMEEDEKILAAYGDAFSSDLSLLLSLQQAAASKEWDRIRVELVFFSFASLKPLKGYQDDPLKSKVSGNRDAVKAVIKKLKALFFSSDEECREDIRALLPIVEELFEAVALFSQRLDAMKAERKIADFGDLEHWALRLLVEPLENGGFQRTEDAVALSEGFDEVMVDEYQDTNEAQDMIFRAVSREESNLFMVGDVKQSIYRFRQAMPEIFLRRKEDYARYDPVKNEYPAKVILDKNFRSRAGVTQAVNFVFRQVMSPEMGEMAYTEEEELKPGASYPERAKADTELHILALPEDGDMDVAEARHIAGLIREKIEAGELVQDGAGQRPCSYRDFCVLIRNANAHAGVYAQELRAMGIPAWSDTAGTFFGTPEVSTALSFLRVIDNPVQDIPLLSALLSPVCGFTPDDLSLIRLERPGGAFYFALKAAAQREDELGLRCRSFFDQIEAWRRLAATMPADRLLRHVYETTGYTAMVQAMRQGEPRLNNLRMLLRYARDYESSGYKGLSGFIRFIDRLQQQNEDLMPAAALSESANVVRIMSVHKSKGLEFPICILANMARQFNKQKEDILLHPVLGLGLKLRDEERGVQYPTMPREAVGLEIERGGMSEELRVLYVAMTRAKETLLLLTSLKDPVKTLGKLGAQLTDTPAIPPYVVRSAASFSDWILSCALRHPDGKELREKAGVAALPLAEAEPWKIELIYPKEARDPGENSAADSVKAQTGEGLLKLIGARLNARYGADGLQSIPAKVAASELAARENEALFAASSRPAFLSGQTMTAAERGTALHSYMQYADYALGGKDARGQLAALVEKGFLTKEQGLAVDLKKVERFFSSGLYKRIAASEKVYREYRFTVEIPAKELDSALRGEDAEEAVVLQGAVDCAFVEDGALVIVDYKTDAAREEQKLITLYQKQLELYSLALKQCTGLTVKGRFLYSFSLGREIEIP